MNSDAPSRKLSHTPGPWTEFADRGKTVALMPAGRPGDVCTFAEPYPSDADARLMAAAPLLAVAAQGIDHWLLVIESAVRNADPRNHAGVLAALMVNRDFLRQALGAGGDENKTARHSNSESPDQ